MVIVDYESDDILAEPLTSRAKTKLLRAVKKLYENLNDRGLQPHLHTLGNELSSLMNNFIREAGETHQLVLPGLHQATIAEREIQRSKAHLISGISSCDPNFPFHLWDRLIRQAELTLNLLRPAHTNPRLSLEVYLNGDFDFNLTPLSPPGTRILIFEGPTKRRRFAYTGFERWYLGPAPEH